MKKTAGILTMLLLCLSPLFSEENEYTNYSFARLSHITGNTYIQRAADLGYEEGVVNMPITEGDRLGTTDGRAEVYLGKSNYIRLDKETKIDFLNLPKKGYDLIRIRHWAGNIYLSVKSLEEEKNIEVHTSDVSFYLLDKGIYRIDVRDRETEIFVFEGMVEAAGEDGSVLIKDSQRLEVSNARFTSSPTRFSGVAEDSFDRWSENRESKIRKHLAKAYLPEELEDFENELALYGDWIYIPPYGYVWVPGGVDASWRPYYYGRWTWLPLCGWTWIPYEPWGWSTFHFGRWHWRYGLGWYWIPTSFWGPAWVSWYWGYDYFGWVPLSYYGYPGVILNNVYYSRYYASYPYSSRALTVIHKNQLKARDVSKVALSQTTIKKLGKINLSNQQIDIRPAASKVATEKLSGKRLMLKKIEAPPVPARAKRIEQSSLTKSRLSEVKRTEKRAPGIFPSTKEKKIIEKKSTSGSISKSDAKKVPFGYPPSPEISSKKSPRKIKSRKSSSLLNQIYKNLPSSKYIRSRSSKTSTSSTSKGTTSRRISSTSKGRTSSPSSSRVSRGTSSRSSKSSSSSGKVRKKK